MQKDFKCHQRLHAKMPLVLGKQLRLHEEELKQQ